MLFDDPLDSQASQVVPSVYTPLAKTLALVGLCLLVWMPAAIELACTLAPARREVKGDFNTGDYDLRVLSDSNQ